MTSFIDIQAHAWEEIREWAQEAEAAPFIPVQPGGSWDGPGSALAATEVLTTALPALLRKYGVRSMLDVACGDWNWMRLVDLQGAGIDYIGWDVDPGRIERCRERVLTGDHLSYCRPGTSFECVNMLTTEIDVRYDLILARDFLAHLPNQHIEQVLEKFRYSGSTYLLASSYPGAENAWTYDPAQFAWSGYMEHPVDLETAPYNLRKIDAIPEVCGPGGVLTYPHELALFQIGDRPR